MVYARVQKESRTDEVTWPEVGGGTAKGVGPPHSLAEQLKQVRIYFSSFFFYKQLIKQVLAEREKRLGSDSVTSSTDELSEKSKDDPAHHLLEEIRQAVSEANAKGT